MKKVATFKFYSNVLYVQHNLDNANINHNVIEGEEKEIKCYHIEVSEEKYEYSKKLIDRLSIDDSNISSSTNKTLSDYKEWSENMYNPGHYTGGNIPHFMFDKRSWFILIPLYISFGLFLIYQIKYDVLDTLIGIIILFVYVYLGVKYITKIRNSSKK